VIRADEVNEHGGMEPIIIGANSNIQDGAVLHRSRPVRGGRQRIYRFQLGAV
jgi:carbonic anhydrase/acetyltransferase-like protein (isoleucine patch superfamily)